jgi:hypothetical protein
MAYHPETSINKLLKSRDVRKAVPQACFACWDVSVFRIAAHPAMQKEVSRATKHADRPATEIFDSFRSQSEQCKLPLEIEK